MAKGRTARKSKPKPKALHQKRFPAEPAKHRTARNALLKEEMALRAATERVAALRRKLPMGAAVAQDYVFDAPNGARVGLSELFEDGKDSLIVYNYMYGPAMSAPCVMCTSILDSIDGASPHVTQRTNLVVVAKSPIDRILDFARGRGWRNLRLLSSAGNSFNRDYFGETDTGAQM